MSTTILQAQLEDEIRDKDAIAAERDLILQERNQLAEALEEREAKIAALEAQVVALTAKAGRKPTPPAANVQALPKLVADARGKAVCAAVSADGKPHGVVAPNVRGTCPTCYSEAIRANQMAAYAAKRAPETATPAAA